MTQLAVLQVLEETSLNIRPLLNEEHKIERLFNEQECCMFIVSGVRNISSLKTVRCFAMMSIWGAQRPYCALEGRRRGRLG